MFRKADDHKKTASIGQDNRVRVFCDDGFEDILDFHFDVADEAEGRARLLEMGYEEYDPNAALKAAGFVFKDGIYQKP